MMQPTSNYPDWLGAGSLHHDADSGRIAAGIVIVALKGATKALFQLRDEISLWTPPEYLEVLPGSLVHLRAGRALFTRAPIAYCRFPTETELKVYEAKETV